MPLDKEEKRAIRSGTYEDHYEEVKKLQGEAIKYYLSIQNEKLEQEESEQLNKHAHALNHLLKSAKRLKDVVHNIRDFESSGNDVKHGLFEFLQEKCTKLYTNFHELLLSKNTKSYFKSLRDLIRKNRRNFEEVLEEVHQKAQDGDFTEVEIATFYNANHEIYSANKAFLEAMADMMLTPKEINEIENLPEMR
jgi:phosphate:Na+ symporter